MLAAACAALAMGAGRDALAADPVRIGLILDLTGPLATASGDIAFGFALALDMADRRAAGRAC